VTRARPTGTSVVLHLMPPPVATAAPSDTPTALSFALPLVLISLSQVSVVKHTRKNTHTHKHTQTRTHSHTHTHTHTHTRAHQDLDCRVCIHPPENRGPFSPLNLHPKLSLHKERRWERGVTPMTSERACS
jgi:hypothetical protein